MRLVQKCTFGNGVVIQSQYRNYLFSKLNTDCPAEPLVLRVAVSYQWPSPSKHSGASLLIHTFWPFLWLDGPSPFHHLSLCTILTWPQCQLSSHQLGSPGGSLWQWQEYLSLQVAGCLGCTSVHSDVPAGVWSKYHEASHCVAVQQWSQWQVVPHA